MNKVLLIEDDQMLGDGLTQFLQQRGFECNWQQNLSKIAKVWLTADVVVLDRQMPEGDTLQWLPEWLSLKAIPVIILTAKSEVDDRIDGLATGAKDYVVKPFNQHELLARIHAQLRPLGDSIVSYKNVQLNIASQLVTRGEQKIEFKPKEFKLLSLLVQNTNRVFHREELLNKIWGFQAFPTTRTVDNHILNLRKKLPELEIETVRGVGYRLSNGND